eukprot:771621-Pelagomonas_calceolata.AAC.1
MSGCRKDVENVRDLNREEWNNLVTWSAPAAVGWWSSWAWEKGGRGAHVQLFVLRCCAQKGCRPLYILDCCTLTRAQDEHHVSQRSASVPTWQAEARKPSMLQSVLQRIHPWVACRTASILAGFQKTLCLLDSYGQEKKKKEKPTLEKPTLKAVFTKERKASPKLVRNFRNFDRGDPPPQR